MYNTGIDRASEANNSSQADKKSGKIETWCKEMSSERRGQPPLAKLPARAHSVLQATSILSGTRCPYLFQCLWDSGISVLSPQLWEGQNIVCLCAGPPPVTMTQPPPPHPSFKVGMKLEAVDRRFPYFVCVATIMDRTGQPVCLYIMNYLTCTHTYTYTHTHAVKYVYISSVHYELIYKYHHSTKLYRKISRVCCRGIVTSAKHE